MKKPDQKVTTILVNPPEWERFKVLCRRNGTSATRRISHYINNEVAVAIAAGIDLDSPETKPWPIRQL